MSYYDTIYQQRLNRYGTNPMERLEGARNANFERFLLQSPHRVFFEYSNEEIDGVLEPKSQDETLTTMNLLVRTNQHFKIGDIITINDIKFLIYYWAQRQDSGYNKYILMKITHEIDWIDKNNIGHTSNAYMYTQETGIKNMDTSASRASALYFENPNLTYVVIPYNDNLELGTYVTVRVQDIKQHFTVSGYDIVSTPGIQYVSLDPTYKHDETPMPSPREGDSDSEFFWSGGIK